METFDSSKTSENKEVSQTDCNMSLDTNGPQLKDFSFYVETEINLVKSNNVISIEVEVDLDDILYKKKKPKKDFKGLVQNRLLSIDLSFIPSDKLTKDVVNASKTKMIKYDSNESLIFEIGPDDMKLCQKVSEYERNFISFVGLLEKLGNDLYKTKDFEIAVNIFNYLIKLQSINLKAIDNLFDYYIHKDDKEKIYQIVSFVESEIRRIQKNPDVKNHKWWEIKVKYSEYFGGLDEIMYEMRKALRKVTQRYDASSIYNCMAVLLTKYKKHKEAITAHLLGYYYCIDYNSHYRGNDVDYFLAKESIERDLIKFLKGTPYETKQKELTVMFRDYLIIRNNALGVLETNVNLICN